MPSVESVNRTLTAVIVYEQTSMKKAGLEAPFFKSQVQSQRVEREFLLDFTKVGIAKLMPHTNSFSKANEIPLENGALYFFHKTWIKNDILLYVYDVRKNVQGWVHSSDIAVFNEYDPGFFDMYYEIALIGPKQQNKEPENKSMGEAKEKMKRTSAKPFKFQMNPLKLKDPQLKKKLKKLFNNIPGTRRFILEATYNKQEMKLDLFQLASHVLF